MKLNMPITDREIQLSDGHSLVTKTDLKGKIVFANPAFIEISGYSKDELIGCDHNVVRHPDMPVEVFKNLWDTLSLGRPWSKCVKNRCKNGDYYWVKANVTPVFEGEEVAGYMSVRTKATADDISSAEALYEKLSQKTARLPDPASIVEKKLQREFNQYALLALVSMLALFAAVYWFELPVQLYTIGPLCAFVMIYFSSQYLIRHQVITPLEEIKKAMVNISGGDYLTHISLQDGGEIGEMKRAVNMLGVKLGFEVNEILQQAQKNTRIKVALDNVSSSVMFADNEGKIIYTNESVRRLMTDAQSEIRKQVTGFESSELLGNNLDVFHAHPQEQRNILHSLTSAYRVQIELGDCAMELTANPVIDEGGTRLGTVVEWQNLTQQLTAEREIQTLIENASKGDFVQRLDVNKYSGFMHTISDGVNTMMDSVTQPMSEAKRVLECVAQGDLTQQMQGDFRGDFEQLNVAVNTSIMNLSNMVGKIRNAGDNIKTGASEIAAGNATLSGRTESQAATLEETASSMEQMTGTVKSNAQNAAEAKDLSEKSQKLAKKGGEISQRVISSMLDISNSSSEIAEIITVIDEIAFQTNLLALNAAVEAARAGDQGRGFAVVASEVRILAQRSAKAAKEIKSLIHESAEKVAEGNAFVIESGEALKDIIESIQNVTVLANEIAASSKEQATGIGQVNIAVNKMDEVVQQNAALVEEVSAASISLDGEAVQLKSLVREFTVNQTSEIERREERVNKGVAVGEPVAGQLRKRKANNQQEKIFQMSESGEQWEEF